MTEPSVSTVVQGGTVYGVAGAGTVIIENFYANRGPEPATARAEAKGPLPPCPYPGLSYFGPEERSVFHGRDQAIAGLMASVPKHGLTALVGASGSGKSSVVLAGLAPSLADTGGWIFSYFRVGTETDKNPFMALARAVTPLFSTETSAVNRLSEVSALAKRLESGELSLPTVLGECRQRNKGKRVLLIADQFEEVFTLVGDESVRQRFIEVLLSGFAGSGEAPEVCLLLTLRADFYNMALRHRSLSDALQGHVENLGPMTREELQEAIEKPAGAVTFEKGLVDTLLDDVSSRPGNLPLLQFALREMWLRQENGCITHQAYQDIGRVEGALAKRAHEIFEKITNGGNDEATVMLFRRLFTRMVTLGEGAQDTRRVVSRRELGDEAWGLAQRLAGEDNRLVVTGAATAGSETAEVVHEALIRNWPDLVGWVDRDRAFQTWLRQLRPRVEEWQANPTDEGTQLRGGTLAIAGEWLNTRGGELAPEEKEFIQTSIDARTAEKRLKEEKAKAARRRSRVIAAVSMIAAVLMAALSGYAIWQRNVAQDALAAHAAAAAEALKQQAAAEQAAEKEREAAEAADAARVAAQQAAREADAAESKVRLVQRLARHTGDAGATPQRSLLLGIAAARLESAAQSGSPLAAIDEVRKQLQLTGGVALKGHLSATRVTTFSRSSRRLATGSDDGAVWLWDVAGPDPAGTPVIESGAKISALSFSPRGDWLFTGDAGGTIRSFQIGETTIAEGPSRSDYGAILALETDPKGRWLAFGTTGGQVCIWSLTDKGFAESPCWQYGNTVARVQFSSGGRWLAAAGGHHNAAVALWDLAAGLSQNGPSLFAPTADLDWMTAFAFSADERRLAVAYGVAAEVWDLTQPIPPEHVVGRGSHSQWISSVDLSPDGTWLATASSDSRVKLWRLDGSAEPIQLEGHTAPVNSVVFSDDGRWLLTASNDTTARLWDLSGLRTIPSKVLRGQDRPLTRAIFSPGSVPRYIITVGEDPQPRLWTTSNLSPDPVALKGHVGAVTAAALSPDGKWLASSGFLDRKLRVRSLENLRAPVRELPLPNFARTIAFSRDGRWLAVSMELTSTIHVWHFPELGTPLELVSGEPPPDPSLGFSLDGHWLAAGIWWPPAINLWDFANGEPSTEPDWTCAAGEAVRAMDIGGSYALTGEHGWYARLWDLDAANPCEAPLILGPHNDAIPRVAMSMDGHWAATVSFDTTGKVWDLSAKGAPRQFAEIRFGSRATSAAFSPDGRWAAFGGWDGGIGVIDLKAEGEPKPLVVSGHAGRTNSVAFTPDSKFLITSGEDRTAKMWNPADLHEAPVVLRGHEGTVTIIGVSPDSRRLLTFDDTGTILVWNLQLPDLIDIACAVAGRQLSPDEVREFLGSDVSELPCPDQPKLAQ